MKGFSALIISILLLGMLFASTPTPATANSEPPEWGDWVIKENTTVTGETIVVNGVIVENGSALTLDNCVLKIDWGVTGYNGIKVEAGGELYVYNSTITAYQPYQYYRFDVYGMLRSDGADISKMYIWGLHICDTKEILIENSNIHDNILNGNGITFSNSNGTVLRSSIYKNYAGITCRDFSNVTIAENNIKSNIGVGVGCRYNSTVSLGNNIVSENELHGIEVTQDATAHIANNTITSNNKIGILCLDNSLVSIDNNIISNHPERGISIGDNSAVEIVDNTITKNKRVGIICGDNSTVEIIGNTITNSENVGVDCQGCAIVSITENLIASNHRGTNIQNSAIVAIVNNTITSNDDQGITCRDSSVVNINNNIISKTKGGFRESTAIHAQGFSTVIINNNDIISNEKGVTVLDLADVKIYNSSITNSIAYDIWVDNSSHATIINTNFDLNKLSFNDTESIISIGHWVGVNVKNKNNVPVQNAEITVKNSNGIEVFNGSTDYDGQVSCIPVVEYDLDYTFNKTTYTPHNVYASKLGKSDSEKITIDRNRVIDFALDVSDKLARGNLIIRVVEGHEVSVEYSGNGTVTIEPAKMIPELPESAKDIGIFFDLKTEGEVEELYITVRYSDEELEGVNEADLRMYCYFDPGEYDPGEYDPSEYDPGEYDPGEYGGWVMIKNSGVDIHSNVVWAKVSHTTIFAPMARETSKQTGPGTTATWLWYSSIVAVLAILLLIFIPVMMKKKKK